MATERERPGPEPADQPDAPGHHPEPDPGELEPQDPGVAGDPADEPPGHHPDPDPADL